MSACLSLLLPGFINSLSHGAHQALLYQFFKIGALAVTPVFLGKMVLFLVLLFSIANLVQKFLLTRILTHLNIAASLKFALGRFATYLLIVGGLFIGLQTLGVNLSSLVVFGGAVGVGVGLGLQNVVSNFVAGLILLIEQPIRIGDRVETDNTLGDVVRIAARSTWIRTNDNTVKIVPNNEFINKAVTNWTANDPNVRVHVPVGVGYASDPEQVRDLLMAAADAHPEVLKEPKPMVLFTDYGDNSINFDLMVWTASFAHKPGFLKSDLYFALFKTFGEKGIELPFPQRDIHVRSSDIPLPFGGPADVSNSEATKKSKSEQKSGKDRPVRAGASWGRAEDEHLRELFKAGESLRNIADELDRTGGSITARLVRLHLVENRAEARELLARGGQ